ncbi:HNH endonuclease family protein [Streptomyces sp. NPDC012769]|uniref:HNH endonuclease family protein n=1 Tax=Streptomyces sp. NPDC012769 TaxID=3364848 RepID=UPI0036BE3F81
MIKHLAHGFTALTLALASLAVPAAAQAAAASPGDAHTFPLTYAVNEIPVADESRTGYERTKFKHWNAGLDRGDGCHTRNEVLLTEATEAPTVVVGCKLSGGEWLSYYDEQEVTDPAALDIDHMVPLAEAWDSGASAWDAKRREAYANDQDAATSLVAVTARTNRSKADQDPSEWMPPAPSATCRYLGEWVATKLRWGLTADQAEIDAIGVYAGGPCSEQVVHYVVAP